MMKICAAIILTLVGCPAAFAQITKVTPPPVKPADGVTEGERTANAIRNRATLKRLAQEDKNWKIAADGGDAWFLINVKTTKTENGRRLTELKYVGKDGPVEPIAYSVTLQSSDCGRRVIKSVKVSFYKKTGELLSSKNLNTLDEIVRPDTLKEDIFLKICAVK